MPRENALSEKRDCAPQEIHFSGRLGKHERTRGIYRSYRRNVYAMSAFRWGRWYLFALGIIPESWCTSTGSTFRARRPSHRFASLRLCPRSPRFNYLLPPTIFHPSVASTTILSAVCRVFLFVSSFSGSHTHTHPLRPTAVLQSLSWVRIMSNVRARIHTRGNVTPVFTTASVTLLQMIPPLFDDWSLLSWTVTVYIHSLHAMKYLYWRFISFKLTLHTILIWSFNNC